MKKSLLCLSASLLALPVAVLTGCSGGNGGNSLLGVPTATPNGNVIATSTPSSPGPTATPTRPSPTTTPTRPAPTATPVSSVLAFAGDYVARFRDDSDGITEVYFFRINANGTIINTDPNLDSTFSGSVNNNGALRFTTSLRPSDGLITVTANLSGRNPIIGTGRQTSGSRNADGSILVRSKTPASPFAGNYTGFARITAGQDAGKTFRFTAAVGSDGTIFMRAPDFSLNAFSVIAPNGTFDLGGLNLFNEVTVISGVASNRVLSGTFSDEDGNSGTFSLSPF